MSNDDPTEQIRRERQAELNGNPGSREALQVKYGQVWNTTELMRDFEVVGYSAPLTVVRKRDTGELGSLEFQHSPRLYFNFVLHEGQR